MLSEYNPRYPENEAMRHAFATHCANSGGDMAAIPKYLGHRDQRTTALYMRSGPGALLEVVKS